MSFLYNPIGLVADIISIANALGLETPYQRNTREKFTNILEGIEYNVEELRKDAEKSSQDIKGQITMIGVMLVRQNLPEGIAIEDYRLELLIRVLLVIKWYAPYNIFSIIIRYEKGTKTHTLGFAIESYEDIKSVVHKISEKVESSDKIKSDKTCYITTRTRGKFSQKVEHRVLASLLILATEVFGVSRTIKRSDMTKSLLEFDGHNTILLTTPSNLDEDISETEFTRRVFLVGGSGAGKSTIGNALLGKEKFFTSRGITGTLGIQKATRVETIREDVWKVEIHDTPGLSDENDLDPLYLANIEDKITKLQRMSSLILCISAGSRVITSAVSKSIQKYKDLFGESIASMLIVIFTLDKPADEVYLKETIDDHYDTLTKIDSRISLENVYSLSLSDLRDHNSSKSEESLLQIMNKIKGSEMKIIESLKDKFSNLQHALKNEAEDYKSKMRKIVNGGWITYDMLMNSFRYSSWRKLSTRHWNGFIFKNPSDYSMSCKSALSQTVSIAMLTFHGDKASKTWEKFLSNNKFKNSHYGQSDSELMQVFSETLIENQLDLVVQESETFSAKSILSKVSETFFSLSGQYYNIYRIQVIDSSSMARKELAGIFDKIVNDLNARENGMSPRTLNYLEQTAL